MRCLSLSIYLLIFASLMVSGDANANEIFLCDDEVGYPPYVYEKRARDSVTDRPRGATYDLLSEIETVSDLKFKVSLLPWKRCLKAVKVNRGYNAVINAVFTPQRNADYLASDAIFTISNAYWYDRKLFPVAPLKDKNSSKSLTLCKILGYEAGWRKGYAKFAKTLELDSYAKAFKMLKLRRCDVIDGPIPVIRGLESVNIPPNVVAARIVEKDPKTYHMFVSRRVADGPLFIAEFNKALSLLKNEGRVDTIFKKYLPECGAQC